MPAGYVYMLASKRNGTLYTGVAANVPERLELHRAGLGSKFVARYGVYRLVWYERHELYTSAMQRETSIKRWKRAWKIALIEKDNPRWEDLYDKWSG